MYSKLVRLTKDAELQTTQSGKQVCKISCCHDVGWGDSKRTVWIEATLWGDRGNKLAQYMVKGSQVVLHADDVEPDAYQGAKGLSTKLKMTVINVELVARATDNYVKEQQAFAPKIDDKHTNSFNDFDSETIPF